MDWPEAVDCLCAGQLVRRPSWPIETLVYPNIEVGNFLITDGHDLTPIDLSADDWQIAGTIQ